MELRVGSWCRLLDGVCDGSFADLATAFFPPVDAHLHYFDQDSESAFAAREAMEALQVFLPAHAADFDVSWNQFVFGAKGADLAIVFDTTGSMGGAIADAKTQATNLAQAWLNFFRNGRVGLVDFKDVDQGDPYAARVDLGLTNDVNAFQTAVNTLAASGGGDIPEAQLSGVTTALDGLDWADGATKVTIVITDAPGKDPEPVTGLTRDSVSQHALAIDPVTIYGVNVSGGSDVTDFMTPLTTGTAGGVFVLQPGQTLSDALFDVLDAAHAAPVAKLRGPYIAETGTAITFSARDSFDASAEITSYKWDFDGDGSIDRTTTTPDTTYTYPGEFHGTASVTVVAADDRSAIATADVTVDGVGLRDVLPLAPTSATASITGTDEATVTWTPTASDRADGYKVFMPDGNLAGLSFAGDPDSIVVSGIDTNQPISFMVVAANGYGFSAAVETPPVGGTAWVPSVKVNDDTGTTQQDRAAITLGPDGASYLIWDDYRTGNQADIYFSRRDPATGTWSANQKVNNDTAGRGQWYPAIAVDSSNNVYAVWQDQRNGNHTPDQDIYFSKRSAATGAWSANVRVNSDTQGTPAQSNPRIGLKGDGSAVAVWLDARSNQTNIYSARLAAGGSTWGTNLRVTSNTSSRKGYPDVVVAADGTAYAVWEDDRNGNYDIWYSKLPAGSSTWSTNVKISDDPGTAAQYGARLGIDGSGNLMVIWLDDRPYPRTEVRMSRLLAGGSTWAASTVVSDAPAYAGAAALAVKPNGNAFAVWEDARGSSWDIWGAYYTATSGTWASPTCLGQTQAILYKGRQLSRWTTPRSSRHGGGLELGRRHVAAGLMEPLGCSRSGPRRPSPARPPRRSARGRGG